MAHCGKAGHQMVLFNLLSVQRKWLVTTDVTLMTNDSTCWPVWYQFPNGNLCTCFNWRMNHTKPSLWCLWSWTRSPCKYKNPTDFQFHFLDSTNFCVFSRMLLLATNQLNFPDFSNADWWCVHVRSAQKCVLSSFHFPTKDSNYRFTFQGGL